MSTRRLPARRRKSHANHKDKGRGSRSELSNRLKDLEDRVATVEERRSSADGVQVNQQITLNIPRSPSSIQPLPWAHLWPDLAGYYYNNAPDFSGHKLFTAQSRTNAEYATLALQEPATFTSQILLAESARVENKISDVRLLWLKSNVISMINEALRDRDRSTTAGLVSAVAAMAIHAIVLLDSESSKAHMKGLKQMLLIRGGLNSLNSHPSIRIAVSYADSVFAYFEGSDRHFTDWSIPTRPLETTVFTAGPAAIPFANCGMFPQLTDVASHPLRLAPQPCYSHLSETRLRIHLFMSLGGPMSALVNYLGAINALAELSLLPPYKKCPQDVRAASNFIEYCLLALNSRLYLYELKHPMFSDLDKFNHHLVHESVLRICLILLSKLLVVIDNTEVIRQRLSHNIQALYVLNLKQISWRNPKFVLWALFTTASFDKDPGYTRDSAIKTISRLCQDLNLTSGAALRDMLAEIFYSPSLQDDAAGALWFEMEPLCRQLIPIVEDIESYS